MSAVDWTKPIRRVDTKYSARVLATDIRSEWSIAIAEESLGGGETVGNYRASEASRLFENAPVLIVRWTNVAIDGIGQPRRSRAEVEGLAALDRAGVVRLTFADGLLVAADIEPAL